MPLLNSLDPRIDALGATPISRWPNREVTRICSLMCQQPPLSLFESILWLQKCAQSAQAPRVREWALQGQPLSSEGQATGVSTPVPSPLSGTVSLQGPQGDWALVVPSSNLLISTAFIASLLFHLTFPLPPRVSGVTSQMNYLLPNPCCRARLGWGPNLGQPLPHCRWRHSYVSSPPTP